MEIAWNRYINEQYYSNDRSDGDFYEQHVARMRASCLAPAKTETIEAKARRSLSKLLNLIPICGRVVLPRNSQN